MSELKPCPFCGSENLTFAQSNEYDDKISCCDCNAFMPRFRNKDKTGIIEAWNRRPPAHKYTLEELREMNGKAIYTKSVRFPGDPGVWELISFAKIPVDGKDIITLMSFSDPDGPYDCFADTYDKTWVAYDREPEEEL